MPGSSAPVPPVRSARALRARGAIACASTIVLLSAAPAAAQSPAASPPPRFIVQAALGATAFPAGGTDDGSAADLLVGGDLTVTPRYAARVQVGVEPVARVTLGVARRLETPAAARSAVLVEAGLAFLHGPRWERGSYAGAGVQTALRGPVALTVDGRVYVTRQTAGFSLFVGAAVGF